MIALIKEGEPYIVADKTIIPDYSMSENVFDESLEYLQYTVEKDGFIQVNMSGFCYFIFKINDNMIIEKEYEENDSDCEFFFSSIYAVKENDIIKIIKHPTDLPYKYECFVIGSRPITNI